MANYSDDFFHPNHQDNTVGLHDNESLYEPSSSNDSHSFSKKQRKELEEQKAADIGWRKVKFSNKNKDGTRNLRKEIEYYSTGYSPGTFIRCPLSGQRTNYRVGTRDEDLFYSVIMATGHNGQKTPDHLYYSSPDEYARHWNVKLNPEETRRWYTRNLAARVNSA